MKPKPIPDKPLPTIMMTPMEDLEYYPLRLIRAKKKTHTLRRSPCRGRKEVRVGRERQGIILNFVRAERMHRTQFDTDRFARADGLRDAKALRECLKRFYNFVPEWMYCCHFELESIGEENSRAG